jgi:hypothetical protein
MTTSCGQKCRDADDIFIKAIEAANPSARPPVILQAFAEFAILESVAVESGFPEDTVLVRG